jgi:hypothetical protein
MTIVFVVILLLSACPFWWVTQAEAQVSGDSLVVSLKSGERVTIALADIQKITFDTATARVRESSPAAGFNISQNFPNPLRTETNIDFDLTAAGSVTVAIYDSKGNLVRLLTVPNAQTGRNRIAWNGRDNYDRPVPSGEYFYEVRFGDEVKTKQMIVIK